LTDNTLQQLREYLDHVSAEVAMDLQPKSPHAARTRRRGVLLGIAAAALVFAVAIPSLLLDSGPTSPTGAIPIRPLDLGTEHIWPDGGFTGTADQLASDFAEKALGWVNATVTSDIQTGPTWTSITHDELGEVRILSIPVGVNERAVIQVGPGVISTNVGEDVGRYFVTLPGLEGAHTADVHIRFRGAETTVLVTASPEDLRQHRVSVSGDSFPLTVVAVYRNSDGDAIGADGGSFGG
jgi:hypothetical protein